jgi:peroxiredoxin
MLRASSLVLSLALASLALAQPAIERDATGQRLADVTRLELKPFPASWDSLSAWSAPGEDNKPITSASISGKPVLIVTWAAWSSASGKALALAQRMNDRFKSQGLVVVAVHNPQGFDAAPQMAKDRAITFPISHDSKGEFRAALKVDHDPSYYLIDRSGNLRYAAVAAPSVESAVESLVNETLAQASNLPGLLKQRDDAAIAAGRRTGGIRDDLDLSSLPPLPPDFNPPAAAAYKGLDWPKMSGEAAKQMGLVDDKDEPHDTKLAFKPTRFYPSLPETRGRASIVYLWNPRARWTYEQVMPQMDQLQQAHARDLVIVGAYVPLAESDEQKKEKPDAMSKQFDAFTSSRTFRHTIAFDPGSTALSTLGSRGGNDIVSNTRPTLAIVSSSDGIIRWVGSVGSPGFKHAIDTVLAVDPGVKARQDADRAFIERKK